MNSTRTHNLLTGIVAVFVVLLPATVYCQAGAMSTDDPRIEKLLTQLTLEEKISLLGGTGFETKPIPRLGIPPMNMTDGPVGVRWKESSAFPVSVMMAASWDPDLIKTLGKDLGQEAKAKGRHMLLGPCVNIHRQPFGGRNFESFGEDPFLAARMAASYVKGVQTEKVVATTKHYACNNQETERDFTNVTVSERALREIYLPAFEAAVKEGGSMSVMSAYNKVNGLWCSENPHLLTDILKHEWGFRGFVVSDWGAVHHTVPTANAGLDVEMPTGEYLNADSLLPAIKSGEVSVATIDDKVRRLLRTMMWAGLFDGGLQDSGAVNTPEHQHTALEVAREGIVLLKNSGGILPLDRHATKTLAVVGPNAAYARTGGGGSSRVDPIFAISPLEGIRAKLGSSVTIRYAQGCSIEGDLTPIDSSVLYTPDGGGTVHGLKGEYFANRNLEGAPAVVRIDKSIAFDWDDGSPDPRIPNDNFSVRWTGVLVPAHSGRYMLSTMSDDGVRLYVDGAPVIDDWTDHATLTNRYLIALEAGKHYDVRIEYYEHKGGANMKFGWSSADETLQSNAVAAAKGADAVIIVAGLSDQIESEGFDRKTLDLPREQVSLINAVAAVNKNVVVVLNTGAPVVMDGWLEHVPALIESWYPGEEGGNALADVLFGDVNPSGKLPMTFLRSWEDSPAYGNFPGKGAVDYAEGVFVGYRWFDEKKLPVSFPFGYGLSYTTFAYSNLDVTPAAQSDPLSVTVHVDVTNTGKRTGAEVAQLYVHQVKPGVPRPPKELKGFERVALNPGETKTLTFHLDHRSFAYYDSEKNTWVADPGAYEILVGGSSRDIAQRAPFTVR
jgi:beta-glucosidase